MQLQASDAFEKAYRHAIHAEDHEEAGRLHESMCLHAKKSLNHTPTNAPDFDAKDSILNASHGKNYANKKSKEYMEQERKRASK